MTTLYHFAKTVKPAREFGRGLLASRPTYREPYTAADLEWLAADNARREAEAAEDRHYDRLAAEAAALDRLERGLCC